MRMVVRLFAVSLLVWLASCGGSGSSPTSPQGPQSYVVSGTVSEAVDGVSSPVAGRRVDVFIDGSRCVAGQSAECLIEKAEVVTTDQQGRYALQVRVYPRTLMFVTGAGLHAAGEQPCLASALVDRDTTIDVEVLPVDAASTPPQAASPMVTGFVYETTPEGRNPLPGVSAWLEVGTGDSYPVAITHTDDGGRFFFCRVNAPVGMVVSSYLEMEAAGHQNGRVYIQGTRDVSLEIELKR